MLYYMDMCVSRISCACFTRFYGLMMVVSLEKRAIRRASELAVHLCTGTLTFRCLINRNKCRKKIVSEFFSPSFCFFLFVCALISMCITGCVSHFWVDVYGVCVWQNGI